MKHRPHLLILLGLALTSCAAPAISQGHDVPASRAAGEGRPTEPFRREHAGIQEHLHHVHDWVGRLPAAPAAEQGALLQQVVGFFREHLAPHAAWEESHLYPAVDRRAGTGQPFTASMRWEHRVIDRWIAELATLAQAPTPDVVRFARRADNLLGLVWAHFEEEEEVLLPVLDRTMTAAEFAAELGGHTAPQGHRH